MCSPLKNPAFFKSVSIEKGGYALAWGNEIDISEHELWMNGRDSGEQDQGCLQK